jgi:hypothetical protein
MMTTLSAFVPQKQVATPIADFIQELHQKYRNADIQMVQGIEEPTQMLFIVLLSLFSD